MLQEGRECLTRCRIRILRHCFERTEKSAYRLYVPKSGRHRSWTRCEQSHFSGTLGSESSGAAVDAYVFVARFAQPDTSARRRLCCDAIYKIRMRNRKLHLCYYLSDPWLTASSADYESFSGSRIARPPEKRNFGLGSVAAFVWSVRAVCYRVVPQRETTPIASLRAARLNAATRMNPSPRKGAGTGWQ
jgi:hypothetical protein